MSVFHLILAQLDLVGASVRAAMRSPRTLQPLALDATWLAVRDTHTTVLLKQAYALSGDRLERPGHIEVMEVVAMTEPVRGGMGRLSAGKAHVKG